MDKKLYTIKEVAKLSGLPESTLRYYESIGLIPPIRRGASSKQREYSEHDLDLVIAIACLSATGMSIDAMRSYLSNRLRGAEGATVQIELLETQQDKLHEEAVRLAARREYVATKIAFWKAVRSGDSVEVKTIGRHARRLAGALQQGISSLSTHPLKSPVDDRSERENV